MHEQSFMKLLDAAARRRIARACRAPKARMKDKFAFLRVGSEEWNAARAALSAFSGDDDFTARDPRSGAIWQSMSTVRWKGGWLHEFRHRWHPRKRRRLVLRVPASGPWKPKDEEETKRFPHLDHHETA